MKRFLATVCATLWVLPSALYAQGLGASQLILTNSSGGGVILQPDPAALPPLQPLLITPPPTAGHQLVYTPAWTLNRLVKWTNAAAPVLGNSLISDDGTTVEIGNGNLSITNTGTARELRLYEPFDGTNNYTAFRAQAQTSDITYTLPASLTPTSTVAAGILQTDGSGNLSWVTPAAVVAAGGAWLVGGNTFVGAPAVRVLGITSTNGDALALYTDNAERVRITAGGNVGIGTAMPAATLDVVGTAQVSGNTSVGGDLSVGGNGSVTGNLTVAGNTTLGDAATDVVVFTARVGSHVVPSADNTYDLGEDATPLRWRSGYFGTQVKVGASVSLVAATNELAYTGGDGRISVAGASALRVSTNGFERLRVEGSGDVVVQNQAGGTPTTVLRVLGGNGGAGATQVVLQAGAGQSGVNLLEWRDNLGNILGVIDADGLVGIGTATPVQKLHVEGNGSVSAVFVEGGVGVGTVNPLATLHVYDEGTLTLGATRVIIQAGANQSGVNLLEWWDNAGTVLGRIDDAGNLFVNTNTTLGDAAGDVVTVNAGTVALPNIPNNSAATEVLVWNGGDVERRSAAGLISGFAWMLGGNDLTLLGEQKLGTQSNHDLPIITNNVERVRITAAGNVGIGTASPTALLHVAGTGRFDGNLTVAGNTTLGDAATDVVVFTARVGSHVVPSADNTYDLGEDATPLRWRSGYFGTQVKVGASVSLVAATNELAYTGGDGRISVAGASALRVSTNGFERLRVEGSGDVVVQNQAGGTPTTVLRVLGGDNGAGATQVIIQAGVNQAVAGVNLLQWQNNGGAPLGVIRPEGSVVLVYDPPARQAFFAVANPSGVPLIGIGPDPTGWGVGVYEPTGPFGLLRAGMGKVSGEWRVGVGDLAAQNGVLLNWATTGTANEPRIVVANGSLANPVFLVDREGDVTASGNIAITNTDGTARELRLYEPSGAGTNYTAFRAQAQASDITYTLPASLTPTSTVAAGILQTDGSGNLSWLTPSALVSGGAWALTGNSITGTEFLGTTNAQPLVIRTNNTERLRVTAAGDVVVQNQAAGTPTTVLRVLGGNGGAGATQVVLQAGVGQSGVDLLQWRNNGGDPLGFIRPDGSVVVVYDPLTARQAFFAVANPSGVPLIGIGPDPTGWGVGVYEPTGPFGLLRAGMGKVSGEWRVGVGDLAAQNGVLLNWATTGTANEPRIVVANGSLANPVFLVDREGDVTVRGTTVALPNIPSGSTATEVLVWNAGNVERRSAEGVAWLLTGNSGTNPAVNFLGTTDEQPLVIRTDNTERMRITETGDVGIGTNTPAATLDVNGTVAFSATATLTNNGNPLTLPSNVAVVEIADGAGAADINVNPPTTGTQGQVLFIRYSGTQNLTLVGVLPGGGNQTATAQFHAILMYIGGGWRLMSFVD